MALLEQAANAIDSKYRDGLVDEAGPSTPPGVQENHTDGGKQYEPSSACEEDEECVSDQALGRMKASPPPADSVQEELRRCRRCGQDRAGSPDGPEGVPVHFLETILEQSIPLRKLTHGPQLSDIKEESMEDLKEPELYQLYRHGAVRLPSSGRDKRLPNERWERNRQALQYMGLWVDNPEEKDACSSLHYDGDLGSMERVRSCNTSGTCVASLRSTSNPIQERDCTEATSEAASAMTDYEYEAREPQQLPPEAPPHDASRPRYLPLTGPVNSVAKKTGADGGPPQIRVIPPDDDDVNTDISENHVPWNSRVSALMALRRHPYSPPENDSETEASSCSGKSKKPPGMSPLWLSPPSCDMTAGCGGTWV
ncbi:hypothetical protein GMORB2_6809 [Geosmithia morbida]|uniref:Uncharacterized protein n=1 Tax=Geosmithia morbida TaxID=1094350 RepID=A0A9P5D688_9HYPO|nr:uncharacterized protein GMORB2_6809 [Geosmithia morbida]KAF4123259.1 hypothetical protein GMORB2_6809 [Geosmithia morbida]